MCDTNSPEETCSSDRDLKLSSRDAGNMEFENNFEAAQDDDDQTSSPGDATDESGDILPFQSLSVELEEGAESPSMNVDNEEAMESSESTVLSNEGFSSSAALPDDDDDESSAAISPHKLLEQSMISNGDTEPADDASETRMVEMTCMPPEVEDDAAVDYDANVFIHGSDSNLKDNAKSYLEDFLLSSAAPSSSSIGGHDSDSASNEERGTSLYRFPRIVKAMEKADYSILQVLYRLLYLRNAWDTDKILTQRILDFSGFTCDPTSEDYYTRELMLRTISCDVLLNIGKLLCIDNLVATTDFDKLKIDVVSKIMAFLNKPKRTRRPRQAAGTPRRTSHNRGGRGGRAQQRSRTYANPSNNKPEPPPQTKTVPNVRQTKKTVTSEEILRIEENLKKDVQEGKGSSSSQTTTQDQGDSSDTEDTKDLEKKRLRDLSSVFSSVEGTPDDLLYDMYFLLFLEKGKMPEMKEKILDFEGFLFDKTSEEHRNRVDYLNSLKEGIVKDIARSLFLDPKSDKEATVTFLMRFLTRPNEKHLRPIVVQSGMLSDCDFDIEGMSDFDSDDSITCEVVHKKVECIDLISSGADSDEDSNEVVIKQEPPEKVTMPSSAAVPGESAAEPEESAAPVVKVKRTLKDFETITKIVNTHPSEYLVDIFNLLYMTNYEPTTLRNDILSFSGFEFEKGTPEYVKRKQFLDRMLYNSVRRIYNTLIHNTREVKVFSKPTMIGEIFQFLFKLPDTDTSIRPPLPRPNVVTPYNLNILNNKSTAAAANANLDITGKGIQLPSQSGKLSDLKRVFQRVACFPCEYLVDVHKLLFMTDCDMKDIRANIFGFKGFSFDDQSPDFNQRKLYLEYLTFHSLRKISSVLTTKTVDLRNSTKHELASHLTEVLKEYTNTSFETEPIGAGAIPSTSTTGAVPAGVEEIVVTPIIPSRLSPSCSPEAPASASSYDNNTVSSSTSVASKEVAPSPATKAPKTTQKRAPRGKNSKSKKEPDDTNQQFADVNLPEVEKYRSMYHAGRTSSNLPYLYLQNSGMSQAECQPGDRMVSAPPNPAAFGFRPEFMLQQVAAPYAPLIPQPVPFLQPFHIQAPFVLPQATVQPSIKSGIDDDTGRKSKLEIDDGDSIPSSKRIKTVDKHGNGSTMHIIDTHSLAEKKEDSVNSSSSLHLKIRDAMTKASDDEEDCDKPLAALLGHPNDKVLKQQICDIVENTDLQEITINGVIQKIFGMYPKFNLNYRKEFIKSTLRSLLYRLGDNESSSIGSAISGNNNNQSGSPDCSVSTTDPRDSPELKKNPSNSLPADKWKNAGPESFQAKRKR